METDSQTELIDLIALNISNDQFNLIGLDGCPNSGKTDLATILAERFDANKLSIDDYLNKNMGGYQNFIKYDKLKKDLDIEKKDNNLVIVEGVCLMEILKIIEFNVDLLIYVRRISSVGRWVDSDLLFDTKSLEDVIREINIEDNLSREVAEYHANFKPLEKAKFIFNKKEELPC